MRSAVLCSYVGNMYMAEALVAADRIADAVSHLSPEATTVTCGCQHGTTGGKG